MSVQVTGFYAGLLTFVYVALFIGMSRMRNKYKRSLGVDQSHDDMVVADRRHMNFIENVPLALLLIALVEANGGAKAWVHALGALLLVGRIAHPLGLSVTQMAAPARMIGGGATMITQVAAAITLLWLFFR